MSRKELDRLRLVHEVERGYITAAAAAEVVGISYRQFKRVRRRHREEGDKGLAHRVRGRPSNRRTPEASRRKAIEIIGKRYPDFGPTLACEKLEGHGISVSEETVRKRMIAEGLWKPRKRRERHRGRRERRKRFGEMVQMDGSHHDRLEGRGERMVLIAMIDDVTNEVVARFAPAEGFPSVMATLRCRLETHGRPRAICADRHSIWVAQAGGSEDRYERDSTQLRRALKELDIEFIPAGSPQAKGPCGEALRHAPGSPGEGDAPCRDRQHRRCEPVPHRGIPPPAQREVHQGARIKSRRASPPGPKLRPRPHSLGAAREGRPERLHDQVAEPDLPDRETRLSRAEGRESPGGRPRGRIGGDSVSGEEAEVAGDRKGHI